MIYENNYEEIILNYINKMPMPERYKVGKKYYINYIPMGFDIETYTQYKKNAIGRVTEHYTNMYIWQYSFGDTGIVFTGRTWEDLHNLLQLIKKYVCKEQFQTICFIHNMSFESSFMLKELEKYKHSFEIFARSERHPMKIVLDNSIIFLDSAKITGFSLKKLAENYTKTQKMVGDLQYDIPRNKYTILSNDEKKYCENDVLILAEYSRIYAETYLNIGKMPMTSTMVANQVMADKIKELKMQKKVCYLMRDLFPNNKSLYDYYMLFYSGAYTHGMLRNLFITQYDGLAFDVCSEYPYAMMLPEYPVSKFRILRDFNSLKYVLDTKCCLIECILKNVKTKTGVTILSKNKCYDQINCRWDNGRLYEGESVHVYITQIDLKVLKMHYDFNINYISVCYANKGYLPEYIRLTIAELYSKKCLLKNKEGFEIEYMESKKKLNSIYGSLACKVQSEEIVWDDGWKTIEKEYNFEDAWKYKNKAPCWAIFVTSISRHIILSNVKKCVDVSPLYYWYTDTDSIKAKNTPEIIKIFDDYNTETRKNNQIWINDLGLTEKYYGVDFAEMGTFSREDDLIRFKSLGSKRYIAETKHGIESTVAGLPKKAFKKYCDKRKLDYFDAFNDNLLVGCDESEKLMAYYMDEEKHFSVTDLQGNTEEITTQSYVSLIETTFNLKITNDLLELYSERMCSE